MTYQNTKTQRLISLRERIYLLKASTKKYRILKKINERIEKNDAILANKLIELMKAQRA